MSRTRKSPDVRKEEIIAVAIKQAELLGLASLERARIAADLSVSEALVSYHFGTMDKLRRAVVRHAIKQSNVAVTAQAVRLRHPCAVDLPEALQAKVDKHLAAR